MTAEPPQVWRVVRHGDSTGYDAGMKVPVHHRGGKYVVEVPAGRDIEANTALAAVCGYVASRFVDAVEIVPPGQMSRAEMEADLRESIRDLEVRLRATKESGEVTHKLWVGESVERQRDLEHHRRLVDERDNLRADLAGAREGILAAYSVISPLRAHALPDGVDVAKLAKLVAAEMREYAGRMEQRIGAPAAVIAQAQKDSDRLAAEVRRLNGEVSSLRAELDHERACNTVTCGACEALPVGSPCAHCDGTRIAPAVAEVDRLRAAQRDPPR
jgi:hypothetical protein